MHLNAQETVRELGKRKAIRPTVAAHRQVSAVRIARQIGLRGRTACLTAIILRGRAVPTPVRITLDRATRRRTTTATVPAIQTAAALTILRRGPTAILRRTTTIAVPRSRARTIRRPHAPIIHRLRARTRSPRLIRRPAAVTRRPRVPIPRPAAAIRLPHGLIPLRAIVPAEVVAIVVVVAEVPMVGVPPLTAGTNFFLLQKARPDFPGGLFSFRIENLELHPPSQCNR